MPETYPIKTLINNYQGKIYRLALSICRNEKDAEDILQNTLIKIVRKLPTFRNRSNISTWIYRITYNESLMFLRKKRRLYNSSNAYRDYSNRLSRFSMNWSSLPDQELLNKELKMRIEVELKSLPLEYRMPLLLHRVEGLSLAETSKVLGLAQSTVKTRLHRSYLMVKDRISGYFAGLPAKEIEKSKICSIWAGFLFNYSNKKLGPSKKGSFDRHIKDCPGCKKFLNAYQQAIRITGSLECPDIPPELKNKLKNFFLEKS